MPEASWSVPPRTVWVTLKQERSGALGLPDMFVDTWALMRQIQHTERALW